VFRVDRVGERDLVDVAARARHTQPTYDVVGASLTGAEPAGFRRHEYVTTLPARPDAFEVGVEGLRRWAPHHHAGLLVAPSSPPTDGATVAIAAPLGPLTVVAVCRIVAVMDEPDRYGFAYGTLPGHPECGEESFVVSRGPDVRGVSFRIVSVSRPAELLARLGGPVTRAVQRRTTQRYLDGLAGFVASPPAR
jgi:uncharacterized protein (UPF0548 family)